MGICFIVKISTFIVMRIWTVFQGCLKPAYHKEQADIFKNLNVSGAQVSFSQVNLAVGSP